ncbi:hypothetical protein E2562_020970 [Oryza meyeriana var. granulata]|uniref:Uncharacterized protein n=1 Tax=Oryza meyeriana var. granulata TaxID=110450 RepID=A0A6G1DYL8_9ORYZ|nr:hypothetical protein E2562_020970 [Oryza meyeriana var. granulata]
MFHFLSFLPICPRRGSSLGIHGGPPATLPPQATPLPRPLPFSPDGSATSVPPPTPNAATTSSSSTAATCGFRHSYLERSGGERIRSKASSSAAMSGRSGAGRRRAWRRADQGVIERGGCRRIRGKRHRVWRLRADSGSTSSSEAVVPSSSDEAAAAPMPASLANLPVDLIVPFVVSVIMPLSPPLPSPPEEQWASTEWATMASSTATRRREGKLDGYGGMTSSRARRVVWRHRALSNAVPQASFAERGTRAFCGETRLLTKPLGLTRLHSCLQQQSDVCVDAKEGDVDEAPALEQASGARHWGRAAAVAGASVGLVGQAGVRGYATGLGGGGGRLRRGARLSVEVWKEILKQSRSKRRARWRGSPAATRARAGGVEARARGGASPEVAPVAVACRTTKERKRESPNPNGREHENILGTEEHPEIGACHWTWRNHLVALASTLSY